MKECPKCGKCLSDSHEKCPNDESSLEVHLKGSAIIDGKYLLERCLGRGGMGAVYKAQHIELQKFFALKLIKHSILEDSSYLARFRTEAKALGKLKHPNIIEVTDYGIDSREGSIPYLVMEYLEGDTLRNHFNKEGFFVLEKAFPILESTASAIDYAHSCGILHRDLNLKNIFLVKDFSGKPQVKILDFGLARIISEYTQKKEEKIPPKPMPQTQEVPETKEVLQTDETRTLVMDQTGKDDPSMQETILSTLEESENVKAGQLTQVGTIMGTPGYIAPELFKGHPASPASDIYSFGILIYEILVKQKPYESSMSLKDIPETLPIPSTVTTTVPRELDEAITLPIQREPEKRPRKAMDVVRKIQNAYDGYRYRMWRINEVPKRIQIAGILTLAFVLLFLLLPGLTTFRNIENYLKDLHFQLMPLQPPDERILIVSIDEATLEADPTLLAEKADEMGLLLQQVLDAGARGVAIDFILPERWNKSESFAKLVLRNQGKLILASYIRKDSSIIGMECIGGLIMAGLGSIERAQELFGFLNMQPDTDGYIRHTQLGLLNQDGQSMYSMPARAFQILTDSDIPRELALRPLLIDYSIDRSKVQKLSWKDLPSSLNDNPEMFRDKIVLVGGEYEGSQDFHRVPYRSGLSNDEVSGLTIHALTINTLLRDNIIQDVSGSWVLLPMAVVMIIFSALFLIRRRVFFPIIILLLILTGYILLVYFLFLGDQLLLPVGVPLITLIIVLLPIIFIRRKITFVSKPSMGVNKK
ncbi:MAG: protein kinase [Candidatus Aminicenantaceae bacterium]